MRIIGIDQSFTHNAYVCLDDDNVYDFGVFQSDKNQIIFDRAWNIAKEVVGRIIELSPKIVSIEGLAFGRTRGNSSRDLAGLQFVIACYVKNVTGLQVSVIAPTSVKKFATSRGNAKKIDVLNSLPEDIRKQFEDKGYTPKNGLFDLADAYWIAKIANSSHK